MSTAVLGQSEHSWKDKFNHLWANWGDMAQWLFCRSAFSCGSWICKICCLEWGWWEWVCSWEEEIDGQLQDTRIPFHNETHGTQVLCCQSSTKNVCPLELLDNPLVSYHTTKTYCVSDLSSPILCCGDNNIVGVGDIEGRHWSMNHFVLHTSLACINIPWPCRWFDLFLQIRGCWSDSFSPLISVYVVL